MATRTEFDVEQAPPGTFTSFADRWIHVFMAGLFLFLVLAGFIPDSIDKIAAVEAGRRPPFPASLHLHAVLMGPWILLLFAQTLLMAIRRAVFHKQLGMTAFVLAPAIVIVFFVVIRPRATARPT